MLMVQVKELPNGAHRNQSGDSLEAPPGWVVIPPELEGEARDYLPFIQLTLDENGEVESVEPGPQPDSEPAPTYEPSETDNIALALAELATRVEENNTACQLAIAELAQALLGGDE